MVKSDARIPVQSYTDMILGDIIIFLMSTEMTYFSCPTHMVFSLRSTKALQLCKIEQKENQRIIITKHLF